MSAADRFYQIERQIMVGRARGNLTEALEDELLEESDELWRLMTEVERAEADQRVRVYAATEAPEDLRLVDRVIVRGDVFAPRMAA